MKEPLALAATDSYDVFPEVEKARKNIWNKLYLKFPEIKCLFMRTWYQ